MSKALKTVDLSKESTHLFRALLREASYLPDPASRGYIKKYIRFRFREGPKGQITRDSSKNGEDTAAAQIETAVRKARKGLRQLVRANEGEIRPLLRVLLHTYGRTGPRQYELLRPLLAPDVDFQNAPAESESTPRATKRWDITTVPVPDQLIPGTISNGRLQYTISPKYSRLQAICGAQREAKPDSRRASMPKQMSIPATNSWARPMPRNRVKNKVKNLYAKFLDSVLPPLPPQEWKRLKGLAMGTTQWEGIPARRKPPRGSPPLRYAGSDLEKLAHLSDSIGELIYLRSTSNLHASEDDTAIAHIQNPGTTSRLNLPPPDHGKIRQDDSTLRAKILAAATSTEATKGAGYWRSADVWLGDPKAVNKTIGAILKDELRIKILNHNLTGKFRGHTFTPRFMRKLWLEVFQMCPLLEADESGKPNAWKVTFETGKTQGLQRINRGDRNGNAEDARVIDISAERIVELFGPEQLQGKVRSKPRDQDEQSGGMGYPPSNTVLRSIDLGN